MWRRGEGEGEGPLVVVGVGKGGLCGGPPCCEGCCSSIVQCLCVSLLTVFALKGVSIAVRG